MEIYETKEWEEEDAELERLAIQSGGGGSNMAETPYIPPGPIRIPDGLPPEERARRERLREELMKDPRFRKILA